VCEGAVTERQYFEQFAICYKNSRIRVRLADKTGVPFSLVKFAKRYKSEAEKAARREKDQNLSYDSVWCVFDVDDHPQLHEAREMATVNRIDLAISNPCFELWLLLHLRESPGMSHRHDLQHLLKSLIKDYDKQIDFNHYAPGYADAVTRATKLKDLAVEIGELGRNPTTNVYELTELILKGPT
jgi:hypothetical protein